MTAAALSVGLSGLDIEVSWFGDGPKIQDAQSSLPSLQDFLASIGLDEQAFIRSTDATFKLSSVYRDWDKQGGETYVSFGEHGTALNGIDFNQFVTKFRQRGVPLAYGGFCVASLAAAMGRFSHPSRDPSKVLSSYHYAYHFDTQKFCEVLEKLAFDRGLLRRPINVGRVHRDLERNEIARLELDDGRSVEADLYIDCSGCESVLLGGALGEKDQPCGAQVWDTQWTINTVFDSPSTPLTSVKALPQSVLKAIPLQGRMCYQLKVRSSDTPDEAALAILREHCRGEWLGTAHKQRVKTLRRERAWVENCVAIGESAAVMDTLSVDATHLIQTGLANLLTLLSSVPQPQASKNEFNRLHRCEIQHVVDWHDAHYDGAAAHSTPFWKALSAGPWSDALNYKLELFSQRGRLALYDKEIFESSIWHALLYGMGRVPKRYDPLVDTMAFSQSAEHFKKIQSMMHQAASTLPEHSQFLHKLVSHE
jgi:tryptophan halogenase